MPGRVLSDPAILSGKPIIRGSRVSVEFVLELIARGASRDEVLSAYPHLSAEDIEAAVRYAELVKSCDLANADPEVAEIEREMDGLADGIGEP